MIVTRYFSMNYKLLSRFSKKWFLTTAILLAWTIQATALFLQPELRDVPLARLIKNIEKKVEEEPDNPQAHHHLARAHAMAYSKNLDGDAKVKVVTRGGEELPWFGHTPAHVPYASQQGDGSHETRGRESDSASVHLAKAIASYKKALALKPEDPLVIRLGLAWCQKEGGDRKKAVAGLRGVIKVAWEKDGKAELGGMREFVTAEAVGYLLPLLDQEADADEIADLRERRKKLKSLPRPITPIAIPLDDRAGSEDMVDLGARVAFDLDGSGDRGREWPWLRPGVAAWLVHDPQQSGAIVSGIQMFGSRTFNLFFEHGYEALALLDDDRDGRLREGELDGLALWHDSDADGRCTDGEVCPLGDWGILGLNCENELDSQGVRFSPRGVEFNDGTFRPSFDLVLESVPPPSR